MVHSKKSSDLDLGRRPKLESNEFLLWTIQWTKILRCENVVFHWAGTLYRKLTRSQYAATYPALGAGAEVVPVLPDWGERVLVAFAAVDKGRVV